MWYTYIPNMRSVQASLLQISGSFTQCLQAGVITSPLLTANDFWPPPKTKGFLYSMWYAHIPNIRSVQASLLEISCLQGFHNLTPVDPKWPLTSTKNNRVLVLNVVHLHTKYEICPSFPSWDIRLQGFHNLTPADPKWRHDTRTHTHIHTYIDTYIDTYGSMITKVTTSSKPKMLLTEYVMSNDYVTVPTVLYSANKVHSLCVTYSVLHCRYVITVQYIQYSTWRHDIAKS